MRTSDLTRYIASDLVSGMEEIASKMEHFCFYMTYRVHSHPHAGKFDLYWTMSDRSKSHISGNTDGIVSRLSCEYVGELDKTVVLRVTPVRVKRRYLWQEEDKVTEYGVRQPGQGWRTERFPCRSV